MWQFWVAICFVVSIPILTPVFHYMVMSLFTEPARSEPRPRLPRESLYADLMELNPCQLGQHQMQAIYEGVARSLDEKFAHGELDARKSDAVMDAVVSACVAHDGCVVSDLRVRRVVRRIQKRGN